jgi:hypothetical protein
MAATHKLGICLILLLLSTELLNAQEMCSRCRQRERSSCELSCEKFSTSKERGRCRESCLIDTCLDDCGGQGASPNASESTAEGRSLSIVPDIGSLQANLWGQVQPLEGPESSCRVCLNGAKYGGCRSECIDSRYVSQCISRCAKRKCVDACPLPDVEREIDPYRASRKQRCYMCENQAGSDCRQQCGYNETVPGFTACKIACVKRKCRSICGAAQ